MPRIMGQVPEQHPAEDREFVARTVQMSRRPLSRPRHQLPVAMEGALKLKEISYIHAEGYALAS